MPLLVQGGDAEAEPGGAVTELKLRRRDAAAAGGWWWEGAGVRSPSRAAGGSSRWNKNNKSDWTGGSPWSCCM